MIRKILSYKKFNIFLIFLSAFLASIPFFTLSFPHFQFGIIAPFTLIPLFIAARRISQKKETHSSISVCKKAILSIWFFGFIVQIISFFWITKPIIYFGAVPPYLAYLLFIFISTLTSTYFIILFSPFIFSLYYEKKFNKKIPVLPIALVMTLIEICLPRFFDWSFGTQLASNLTLNQINSLFGFNTGSLFIFYISLSFASIVYQKQKIKPIIFSLIVILCVIFFGQIRIHYFNNLLNKQDKMRVAFVQPNFTFNSLASLPLPSKDSQPQSFAIMLKMSEDIIEKSVNFDGKKPDLLVWPESTAPDFFLLTPWQIEAVHHLSQKTGVTFLIQAVEIKPEDIKKLGFYNAPIWSSSVIVNGEGLFPQYFQKWIPMPFGEAFPFENIFPFLGTWYRSLFKNASKLVRGTNYNAIPVTNNVFVTPLICFDTIDQKLSYLSTKYGHSNFLVNQANFVWMVDSNAGLELAMLDQMRAIENGRSVVVAANTGPSLAFDPLGKLILPPTNLLTQNTNFVDIPLYTGKTLFQTVYNWPLVILGLFSLCYFIFITRQSYGAQAKKQ